ncbi:hypothetical protein COU17_02470 [Candidatus Kaiserbacteria bacterium CG10_big_fil_rev_8_21_14_0_10_49_17]|uniref:Uncharacterized protein n=1 Tax=Candidatus Kaiserbacteria bacterium CG10_big_fil_rev_8_21_14_0_10_49_17 TaxID=1974609 RepID=A0A2M6WE15_9BACT|nr:MAG: hypothetical protein COU17_02470 [Candidatus Kaiserbacteria bacterium CG10_big_fil_rev_8_21_14_0_10_49_17]
MRAVRAIGNGALWGLGNAIEWFVFLFLWPFLGIESETWKNLLYPVIIKRVSIAGIACYPLLGTAVLLKLWILVAVFGALFTAGFLALCIASKGLRELRA